VAVSIAGGRCLCRDVFTDPKQLAEWPGQSDCPVLLHHVSAVVRPGEESDQRGVARRSDCNQTGPCHPGGIPARAKAIPRGALDALFAVLFCLLPAIVAGTNAFAFYRDYWDSFFLPSLLGHAPEGSSSTCAQFLSVSKIPIFFGLHRTLQFFLPAAGSAAWVRAIAQSATLLVVLAVDLAGRRARPLHRDTWAFSGYLLGCLLLSPVSEIHHLVFAVPAVCLVGARTFFDRRWTTKTVLTCTGGFVLCFDGAAGLYDKMPFFFLSLVILLALVFLANRDCGGEIGEQSELVRC